MAQFQKIEDSWSDAVNRRDQYGLELVLSPLFVDVSASGDVTTRNQQVAQTDQRRGQDALPHAKGDHGAHAGRYCRRQRHLYLHHKVNSAEVDEKGVFTQVFERVHGGWLCINSQRTLLRQDASAKQKKSSGTETPFHIPLFSKSDKGPQ